VNINTPYANVLIALLTNIKKSANYPNPTSTGSALTPTEITNIISLNANPNYGILAKNGNFTDRAQVVNATALSNASAVTTQIADAFKEEIICKFINLTSVRHNYYRIIVVGQSIKDIGGGVTIKKDLDQDGAIGTADETVGSGLNTDINGDGDKLDNGISETISGIAYANYDQYADEIMGEQKIMAIVHRDALTGEWKIIRYEFMED